MSSIKLCFWCLSNSNEIDVHAASNETLSFLLKYGFDFQKNDAFGRILTDICVNCWSKITNFREFVEKTEKIHRSYTKYFFKNGYNSCMTKDTKVLQNIVEIIRRQHDGDGDDDDKDFKNIEPFVMINVDQINDEKANLSPRDWKSETIDESEDDNHYSDANNYDDIHEGMSTDSENEKDKADEIVQSKVEEKKIEKNESEPSKPKSKPKKRNRSKTADSSEQKEKSKYTKTQEEIAQSWEVVLKYIQMNCGECERKYETFAEIRDHFSKNHRNKNPYVKCCNKRLNRLGVMMDHVKFHNDPEAFKCLECAKCFQDTNRLYEHMTNIHAPKENREFQCEQCSQMFAKRHLLHTHLRLRHINKKDRQYTCPEPNCGQSFVLAGTLRLHTKKVHQLSDSQICDICARFFKSTKSYEYHYAIEHTNIDHRVQCDICKKWFKHLETLKEHMRRHFLDSVKCKYCGQMSTNKKSLRLHMRRKHSDALGCERIEFPCTVCNKTYRTRKTLTEHMTNHTGEAYLYECNFCPKTFRSSANMYAHRKRTHPTEYADQCAIKAKKHIEKINQKSVTEGSM